MYDRFLQRSQAKLAVAEILGLLDRRIRRGLRELSDGELWETSLAFNKRCRELALLDSPYKSAPSMGALHRIWKEHPFKKYLDDEQARRSDWMERTDPERYWGMHYYYKFEREEAWDFIEWIWKKHRGCEDHTVKQHVEMWRKERKKILPTLPVVRATLPTNRYGRPPDHQARGGRPVHSPAEAPKEAQAPVNGKAGTGPGKNFEGEAVQTKGRTSEVVVGGLVYEMWEASAQGEPSPVR